MYRNGDSVDEQKNEGRQEVCYHLISKAEDDQVRESTLKFRIIESRFDICSYEATHHTAHGDTDVRNVALILVRS